MKTTATLKTSPARTSRPALDPKPVAAWAGHKSLDVIRRQCKEAGVELDDRLYREQGYDHVRLIGGGASVTYNSFNGRFFGTTDKGVKFHSDSAEHDAEPWMQALLSFFLVPLADAKSAAPKPATPLSYMLGGAKR